MATARTEPRFVTASHGQVSSPVAVVHVGERDTDAGSAIVAEESPIALVYNGRSHVVTMGTPSDLEDLAVGFSLTECIVDSAAEIERVDVVHASHGVEVQMQVPVDRIEALRERARATAMRTSCGLCGVESIEGMFHVPDALPSTLVVGRDALWAAGRELGALQKLNNETNTVHAAAWASQTGEIQLVREDVGRHNALDKLLGALARSGTPTNAGFVVVTSRASYEMVQKCAVRGVELLAAISRPTGLAIRFAQASGVTLVGLLRGRTANVYTGYDRLT